MSRFVIAAVLGTAIVAATSVGAADDPIASRQAIMKNVGASMGALGKMSKGALEFDAGTAQFALRVINTASFGAGELFPEGSETGGETEASPKIWSDRAGFNDEIVKFQTATSAAVASPPESKEDLGAVLGQVGGNCKSCHEGFRVKK